MTSSTAIFERLQDILRTHVAYTGDIRLEMDLRADLGLDSLQQLTFIVETENAFEVCFAPEAEAELATLDDMVRYIQTQQMQQAPAQASTPASTSTSP